MTKMKFTVISYEMRLKEKTQRYDNMYIMSEKEIVLNKLTRDSRVTFLNIKDFETVAEAQLYKKDLKHG